MSDLKISVFKYMLGPSFGTPVLHIHPLHVFVERGEQMRWVHVESSDAPGAYAPSEDPVVIAGAILQLAIPLIEEAARDFEFFNGGGRYSRNLPALPHDVRIPLSSKGGPGPDASYVVPFTSFPCVCLGSAERNRLINL